MRPVSSWALAVAVLSIIVLPAAILAPVRAQETSPEPDYVIVPGDSIQIIVLGESDLSRTIIVRPDGKISLPLVGELLVAGKTPAQASATITEALAVYLKQPIVTVTVTSFAPRPGPRIFVLGSVRNPGPYEIFTGARVLDAIALAGWTADRAALNDVGIIRRSPDGKFAVTRVNLDRLVRQSDFSQNALLQNADIVYVPQDNRFRWQDIISWISGLSLIRAFFGLP